MTDQEKADRIKNVDDETLGLMTAQTQEQINRLIRIKKIFIAEIKRRRKEAEKAVN